MVACWSAKREATGWPLQMVKRWKQLSTSFQQQIARKMLNYMVNGFKQFVKMSVCLGYVMVHVVICSDTTRPIYPEGLIPWLAHTALWSISKHFQLGKWTKSVPFTFLPSDFYNFWGRFHASREGVVPSIFPFPTKKSTLSRKLFFVRHDESSEEKYQDEESQDGHSSESERNPNELRTYLHNL